MQPLRGKVAVVAGATRGAGRGIACMLGEAGATVYCTGRSTRAYALPFAGGRAQTVGLETKGRERKEIEERETTLNC